MIGIRIGDRMRIVGSMSSAVQIAARREEVSR